MRAAAFDVLVIGGRGVQALRATLVSAGSARLWCAVPDENEAAACSGLATPVLLDPWPGAAHALSELARRTADERRGDVVLLLRAGEAIARGVRDELVAELRPEAAITVLTRTRRAARALRARLRTQPAAAFAPGSGVALTKVAFRSLCDRGWLDGEHIDVATAHAIAGRIETLPRALRGSTLPRLAPLSVTVIVPAHNEAAWIGQTLRSLEAQTHPPDEVIVVDDGSTDASGAIAANLGARVLRPPVRQGQKASAINYGLRFVKTDCVVVLDADTQFHPDAIRHLMLDIESGNDATCGAVLPLIEQGIWARGRAVEYATAMRIHKRVQRRLGSVFVLSGCIAAFRTEALRSVGGFSERTITDDLDATWALHTAGYRVGYQPKAISYTVEPPTWNLYKSQMRRWGAAIYQTLPFHLRRIHRKPALAFIVAAAVWDILTVPLLLLGTLVLLATGRLEASWMIGIWGAVSLAASLVAAISVLGIRRGVADFPASLVLMWTNMYFFVEAFFREWVFRRRTLTWVKGH